MSTWLLRLLRASPWLLLVAWAVGQAVGDRGLVSSWFAYLPAPAVAVYAVAAGVVQLLQRHRRSGIALLLAALMPAWVVAAVDNHGWRSSAPPVPGAGVGTPLRVLHWNVFRGGLGWDGPRDHIRAARPDVVVLSEPPTGIAFASLARDLGSGFVAHGFVARGSESLVVFCRKDDARPPRRIAAEVVPDRYEWLVVDCAVDRERLRILVGDVDADPVQARGPAIAVLREVMNRFRPDLVVGDLNTPRRSRHLTPPPPGYRHAYDVAGRGWSYTWPVPLPILALDHSLVGERLVPVGYALDATRWSDHRLQILDAVLLPSAPGGAALGP